MNVPSKRLGIALVSFVAIMVMLPVVAQAAGTLDLTTFTEHDPNNNVDVLSDTQLSFSNGANGADVYIDISEGDKMYINSSIERTSGTSGTQTYFGMIGNETLGEDGSWGGYVSMGVHYDGIDSALRLKVYTHNGEVGGVGNLDENSKYYVSLIADQSSDTAEAKVYSDPSHSTLVTTSDTISIDSSVTYDRLHAVTSQNTGNGGTVGNVSYRSSTSKISGTVTDGDGNALDGATVTTNASASDTTSADGSYSMDLSDGTYWVNASKPYYEDVNKSITVSGSDETVDFSLPRLGGGEGDNMDFTVGVCYAPENQTFNYGSATASWASQDADYYIGRNTTLFDSEGNTTNVVQDNGVYTVEVETSRGFFRLWNVLPMEDDPLDEYVFYPGFGSGDRMGAASYECVDRDDGNQAPFASFTTTPVVPEIGSSTTFDASLSDDPDGEIESYEWYVDGSSIGSGVVNSHTFNDAQPHNVTLVVTDDGGETARSVQTITAGEARQSVWLTWDPILPAIGDDVTFEATATDPDAVSMYRWTINGQTGVTDGPVATGTFSTGGEHSVKVETLDSDGDVTSSYTSTVYVMSLGDNGAGIGGGGVGGGQYGDNLAPNAFFTQSTFSPAPNETITLSDSSADADGSIDSRQWTLPDGSVRYGTSTDVSFGSPGDYDVTLTVVDDDGASATYTGTVTVFEEGTGAGTTAPNAYFSWEPALPAAGSPVTFTSDSSDTDGQIESYEWSFPDGSTATGQSVDYTFGSQGFKDVTLVVTDDSGETGTYTATVSVGEDPDATEDGTVTTLDVCETPGGDTGIQVEYWDPSYSTSTLDYDVTHDGVTASGSVDFDEPKGYFYGCVVDDEMDPTDGDGDTEAGFSGTYENGTSFSESNSGRLSAFTFGEGVNKQEAGFGGLPSTGGDSGSVPWILLAVGAATGGVLYARSRQTGQGVGTTAMNAVQSVGRIITRLVNRFRQ